MDSMTIYQIIIFTNFLAQKKNCEKKTTRVREENEKDKLLFFFMKGISLHLPDNRYWGDINIKFIELVAFI
jgi:hypothetical protein